MCNANTTICNYYFSFFVKKMYTRKKKSERATVFRNYGDAVIHNITGTKFITLLAAFL